MEETNITKEAFSAHKIINDKEEFNQIAANNIESNVGFEIIVENEQMTGQVGDPEFYVQKIFEVQDNECLPFKVERFAEVSEYVKNINGVHFIRKKILEAPQTEVSVAIESISGKPHEIEEQVNTVQAHEIYEIDNMTTMRLIASYRIEERDPKIFMQEVENIRSKIMLKYTADKIKELVEDANELIVRVDILQPELTNENMSQVVGIISGLDNEYMKIISDLNSFYEVEGFKQSIKELLKNPREIEKKDIINYYPWNEAILSSKADGTHCLLMIGNSYACILTEKGLEKHKLTANKCDDEYIIEGEIINNTIYCYDLHMAGSLKVFKELYIQRLQQLKKVIDQLNSINPGGYKLQIKPYIVVENDFKQDDLKEAFHKVAQGQLPGSPQEIDGIMICTNGDYFNEDIMKWKPANELTIDFYVEKEPIEGKSEIVNYVLYSYVDENTFKRMRFNTLIQTRLKTDKEFVLVPFEPSICQRCYIYSRDTQQDEQESIDGKVCEFKYDIILDQWVLYRVRDDKNPQLMQFGNYFTVAEQVFFNIINFINLESLYNVSFTNEMYFERKRPEQYDNMTKHMNLIKRLVLESQLKRNSTILDLGCGEGEDIHKYATAGISDAIMVDKDIDALEELVTRKNNTKSLQYPAVEAYNIDLEDSSKTDLLISKIEGQRIDSAICSFAIHYFLDNIDKIAQLFSMVIPGGKVFLYYLDGLKIFNLLKSTDNHEIEEADKIKYEIVKQYTENEFAIFGQEIQIRLPFADVPYQEPLVNTQFLKEKLIQHKLEIVSEFNFDITGDYRIFKQEAHQMHESFNELSEADKEYVGLYKCLILEKI